MEWCIPTQTVQLDHVQLGGLVRGAKPIVPLAYKDPDFTFPALSLLLPALPVKSYDPATGRLILSVAESAQTQSKLQTLQDMLLSAVNSQHTVWFAGQARRPQEIRAGFQPLITQGELHLYCPIYESMTQPIPVWAEGGWLSGRPRPGLLAGRTVRIALRLHGISFHLIPGTSQWSGKFRLQHKIIAVLLEPKH
jgi:hypothetical protein